MLNTDSKTANTDGKTISV